MHTVPPELPGPTLHVTPDETPPGYASGMPYQLGADANDVPHVITRWAFTPEERAAIARGDDVYMLTRVTDAPAPPSHLRVGPPVRDARPLPMADLVEIEGGSLDGQMLTAMQVLQLLIDERAEHDGYALVRVVSYADGNDGAERYKLLHRSVDPSIDKPDVETPEWLRDIETNNEDPPEPWQRGVDGEGPE